MDQSFNQTTTPSILPSINFSVNTPHDPNEIIGEYKEFVGIYKNQLPKSNCDIIINAFEYYNNVWHEDNQFPERSLGRYDTACDMRNLHYEDPDQDQIPIVREFLIKSFQEYGRIFQGAAQPQYFTTLKIQKTPPGGGYHVWHCENNGHESSARCLTWIMYLNDVDDGGETEFLYQSLRVKPTAGTIIVWPSGFTHMHRGNPPLSTDKYILTGWTYYHPNS
jgi:hypothetical protein